MSDQLLGIFKILVLALIYLFFLRVLRVVWLEVSGTTTKETLANARANPDTAKQRRRSRQPVGAAVANGQGHEPMSTAADPRATPHEMVVVAPPAQAGRRFPLSKEVTLGRAPGCAVVLDDTFASQIHARCFVSEEGQVLVEDLGSTNGTLVNDTAVHGPTLLRVGDTVRIGSTALELR